MILILQSEIINLELVTDIRMDEEHGEFKIVFSFSFLDDVGNQYFTSFDFVSEKRMEDTFHKIIEGYKNESRLVWIKD